MSPRQRLDKENAIIRQKDEYIDKCAYGTLRGQNSFGHSQVLRIDSLPTVDLLLLWYSEKRDLLLLKIPPIHLVDEDEAERIACVKLLVHGAERSCEVEPTERRGKSVHRLN